MPATSKQTTPPVLRTKVGEQFCEQNHSDELMLQQCFDCDAIQYPPRERCRKCLDDSLVWRATSNTGSVLSVTHLHHSQGEFFLSKIKAKPWPVATVSLENQCLFVHLASATFSSDVIAGSAIKLFTNEDSCGRQVFIGVSTDSDISEIGQRRAIAKAMGLT